MKIVHSTDYIYIHGEDERLASAVLEILRRDLIAFDHVQSWNKSFIAPDSQDWKGAYLDRERNHAFQNTRNLLRSIYLAVAAQKGEFPNQERLISLEFDSIKSLRPY